MLKLKLQSGGGMHSEYCPLCELAYEELPEIDDDDDDYDDDDGVVFPPASDKSDDEKAGAKASSVEQAT